MNKIDTVIMVGLGYIGLPTATVLATHGVKVIGVDVNPSTIETINKGEIHIVEPELDGLVHHVVSNGNLTAQLIPQVGDVFIIAVPTPFKDNHVPDLSYIESAVHSIAKFLVPGNLIILESTSPVGTTEKMSRWLADLRPDLKFPHDKADQANIHLAYCPERVLPGHILRELVDNDRIIGGMTPLAAKMAADLYRIFVEGECILTDARTAEMCKLTENSFRDVNIAFANELSLICDELDIDVWELVRLANHHPRVNILQPGPGVGGHCIAVDPWFIVDKSPKTARLIRTAREVNDHKPHHVIAKVKAAAAKFVNPKIACLGLSFKADIDDLRESPAVDIVQHLKEMKLGEFLVVEPHISELPQSLAGDNLNFMDAREAVAKADIVLLLVNHQAFKEIGMDTLHSKVVIDTRGLWKTQQA